MGVKEINKDPVNPVENKNIDNREQPKQDDAFLSLLAEGGSGVAKKQRLHSERSDIFRLTYEKKKRQKRMIAIALWSFVILVFLVLSTGTVYFLRKIYYLKQSDNTLGELVTQVKVPPSQIYKNQVKLDRLMTKVNEKFVVISDMTQFEGLSKELEKKLGNKDYQSSYAPKDPSKKTLYKKEDGSADDTSKPDKPSKKTMDNKSLNKLLDDVGY